MFRILTRCVSKALSDAIFLDEIHTEGYALYLPVTSALFLNGLPGRSQNLRPSVYTITALQYLTVSTEARLNNYKKLES